MDKQDIELDLQLIKLSEARFENLEKEFNLQPPFYQLAEPERAKAVSLKLWSLFQSPLNSILLEFEKDRSSKNMAKLTDRAGHFYLALRLLPQKELNRLASNDERRKSKQAQAALDQGKSISLDDHTLDFDEIITLACESIGKELKKLSAGTLRSRLEKAQATLKKSNELR